jgi:hypothetical protein
MKKGDLIKKESMGSENIHKSKYLKKLLNHEEWINTGNNLLASAALIEPMVDRFWEKWENFIRDPNYRKEQYSYLKYIGPYFMLISYAIENLFKAAIVQRKKNDFKEYFERKGRLPKDLENHNLIHLANKSGFKAISAYEDLLRRLTRCAVWHGRYPLPLRYKDIDPSEQFIDNEKRLVSYFSGDDIAKIRGLIKEIQYLLKDEQKDSGINM